MYRLLHEVEEFHYFRNLRAVAIMVTEGEGHHWQQLEGPPKPDG